MSANACTNFVMNQGSRQRIKRSQMQMQKKCMTIIGNLGKTEIILLVCANVFTAHKHSMSLDVRFAGKITLMNPLFEMTQSKRFMKQPQNLQVR